MAREAERSELSLDELTTLRQLEARLGVGGGGGHLSQGPTPQIQAQSGASQRQALDAYWEFVRENPQVRNDNFTGFIFITINY